MNDSVARDALVIPRSTRSNFAGILPSSSAASFASCYSLEFSLLTLNKLSVTRVKDLQPYAASGE